jgi:hypothetical protein
MYHPYFRGKQYELITIRESAPSLAAAGFVPIIEPVKESLGGLQRSLEAVCNADGRAIVIVNPFHGDLANGSDGIAALLEASFPDDQRISAGILLKEGMPSPTIQALCDAHHDRGIALVHAGFSEAKMLADSLHNLPDGVRHIFFEQNCTKLYRKHFKDGFRVLMRDGFERRRNRDHPHMELFSDLHVTFEEEGMDGFGDFLIVGDDFFESGGPAYAIAIHLTFIDRDKDNAMFIYHFKSIRQDTPTDAAGKFAEALQAMMDELAKPGCKVLPTAAVAEFRQLHAQGHFPGLGYVKKLSMQHHIQTLARFFAETE